jgi:hypothetical protein
MIEEEKVKSRRAHIALKDRAALGNILKERFFIPCLCSYRCRVLFCLLMLGLPSTHSRGKRRPKVLLNKQLHQNVLSGTIPFTVCRRQLPSAYFNTGKEARTADMIVKDETEGKRKQYEVLLTAPLLAFHSKDTDSVLFQPCDHHLLGLVAALLLKFFPELFQSILCPTTIFYPDSKIMEIRKGSKQERREAKRRRGEGEEEGGRKRRWEGGREIGGQKEKVGATSCNNGQSLSVGYFKKVEDC